VGENAWSVGSDNSVTRVSTKNVILHGPIIEVFRPKYPLAMIQGNLQNGTWTIDKNGFVVDKSGNTMLPSYAVPASVKAGGPNAHLVRRQASTSGSYTVVNSTTITMSNTTIISAGSIVAHPIQPLPSVNINIASSNVAVFNLTLTDFQPGPSDRSHVDMVIVMGTMSTNWMKMNNLKPEDVATQYKQHADDIGQLNTIFGYISTSSLASNPTALAMSIGAGATLIVVLSAADQAVHMNYTALDPTTAAGQVMSAIMSLSKALPQVNVSMVASQVATVTGPLTSTSVTTTNGTVAIVPEIIMISMVDNSKNGGGS